MFSQVCYISVLIDNGANPWTGHKRYFVFQHALVWLRFQTIANPKLPDHAVGTKMTFERLAADMCSGRSPVPLVPELHEARSASIGADRRVAEKCEKPDGARFLEALKSGEIDPHQTIADKARSNAHMGGNPSAQS